MKPITVLIVVAFLLLSGWIIVTGNVMTGLQSDGTIVTIPAGPHANLEATDNADAVLEDAVFSIVWLHDN